jgi:hypothetical protein
MSCKAIATLNERYCVRMEDCVPSPALPGCSPNRRSNGCDRSSIRCSERSATWTSRRRDHRHALGNELSFLLDRSILPR